MLLQVDNRKLHPSSRGTLHLSQVPAMALSKAEASFEHCRRVTFQKELQNSHAPTVVTFSSAAMKTPESVWVRGANTIAAAAAVPLKARERLPAPKQAALRSRTKYVSKVQANDSPRFIHAVTGLDRSAAKRKRAAESTASAAISGKSGHAAGHKHVALSLVLCDKIADFVDEPAKSSEEGSGSATQEGLDSTGVNQGRVLWHNQRQPLPAGSLPSISQDTPFDHTGYGAAVQASQPMRSRAADTDANSAWRLSSEEEHFIQLAWKESRGPHHAHPRIVDIRRRQLATELTPELWATKHLRSSAGAPKSCKSHKLTRPVSAQTRSKFDRPRIWASSMARYESFEQIASLGNAKLQKANQTQPAALGLKAAKRRPTSAGAVRSNLEQRLGARHYAIVGLSEHPAASNVNVGVLSQPTQPCCGQSHPRLLPYAARMEQAASYGGMPKRTSWSGTVRRTAARHDQYIGPLASGSDHTEHVRRAAWDMRHHFELARDRQQEATDEIYSRN